MLKIFRWLFGIKDERNERMVQNLADTSDKKMRSDDNRVKQRKNKASRLFFIQSSFIKGKTEDRSGMIDSLTLSPNGQFEEIILTDQPSIVDKKKGISKVFHEIELAFYNDKDMFQKLRIIKNNDSPVSILHVDEYDHCYLYGKDKGLQIVQLNEERVRFEGDDDDVFYKMTNDCANRLIK